MKPQILLINPYIHDFAAYDLWMKPLGLYWIAGFLESHEFEISMVDCLDRYNPDFLESQGIQKPKGQRNGCGHLPFAMIPKPDLYKKIPRYYRRFGIPLEVFHALLAKVPKPQAILVGSMMTYWYPGVFETIGILKKTFPGVPIVLGGVYATLCFEHARSFSGADAVFSGPAEVNLLRWLDDLTGQKRVYPDYDILPAEALPMPAHHLLSHHSSAVIATSLSCPYNCPYCATHSLQPFLRERPVEKVMQEILYLVRKKHVQNIAFYDDALLVNAENRIVPILEFVANQSFQAYFHTPNGIHASLMTERLTKLFLQARVQTIRFSYERNFSTSEIEDRNLERAIRYFREIAGDKMPKIEVYIKAGLPEQTESHIIEAFTFVHKLGAYIKIADYSPVPGTPDFEKTMAFYGLNREEPLYQNNSTLQYFTGHPDPEIFQQIKSLAGMLNFATEHGISLAGSSRFSTMFINAVSKVSKT